MIPRFWDWEDYFDPETYDPDAESGTLRNLLGIRDPEVLRQVDDASALLDFLGVGSERRIRRELYWPHLGSLSASPGGLGGASRYQ